MCIIVLKNAMIVFDQEVKSFYEIIKRLISYNPAVEIILVL